MHDPSAIVVRDLRHSYGMVEAVRGISFEVRAGEVFGLLGPNGAGKTTTVEILEGFRTRTSGEVAVLGTDPEQGGRAWRERIGMVFQESDLNPVLTVAETLAMFARFYRRPRAIEDVMVLVGLAAKVDARVATLSGGERRRLDVGVALVGDPDLLFLDEPTTGFDPSARRDAWDMIDGLRGLGTTVVLTTHYMDEAQHLADRVAILSQGVIAAIGNPRELSASGRATTVIAFRLPDGVSVRDVRSQVASPVQSDGRELTIRTENAQRTLYELTAWAEREGIALADLTAARPSLEDTFLELTGAAHD
jgi:ABC-2 type transport system ATP-binding protein